MPPRLPFFKKETPYSCVPACLRIVLSHFGIEASEDELRLRSLTSLWGTNASDAIACVKSFGLQAEEVREATVENLREWLNHGLFPILLIDPRPIRGEVGRHAIVTEGISENQLLYLDPLTGRRVLGLHVIEQAWRLNHYRVILISPSQAGTRQVAHHQSQE